MRRINQYIYQNPDWPNFYWNTEKLLVQLTEVRNQQGRLLGRVSGLGFDLKDRADLEILTQDIVKSSAIEGEILEQNQVRSSLARRLGLEVSGLVPSDRIVDAVVDMILDATRNFARPLTVERLQGWHNALFPGGYSGMLKITAGRFRDDSTGPMQVISGPAGREKVHYQVPAAESLKNEMQIFLNWFNGRQNIDLVIKAALAHLWFVTLHPFDDGNGRIARAVTDMVLSRSDGQAYRFYSMSAQIRKERKDYYNVLEKTQKGSLDVTGWLEWFLQCLQNAINDSEAILAKVLQKHEFWLKNATQIGNDRQQKVLNLLLDGFEGKLTSSKWAKLCKCSQDTALRDINDLLHKKILKKLPGGSRSTAYDIA